MKRIAQLLLISILLVYASQANSQESNYKKIAELFDVPEEAKKSNQNPSDFWSILLSNNDKLDEFVKSIKKMKGAEKEALEQASKLTYTPHYDPYLCEELQGFCDTLLLDMGISNTIGEIKCSLHVTIDEEPNAYTILTPGGFSIYITSGLLEKQYCSYDILMGVIAHELTHGIYFHHLQRLYAEAKKKREIEEYVAIIGGLSAFTEAYDNASGRESSSKIDIQEIKNHLKSETAKYIIRFGRIEEYEADITAFRFMQWIGKDHVYIDLLNFFGVDYDFLYSDYSDHPKTSDRIGLIQYLMNHPEVKNKQIEQLRKNKNIKTVRKRKNDYISDYDDIY